MSNIPTPKQIPPTPQQVDRTLQSAVQAAQQLIASDPKHFANLRASFLALYTHPTFQLILGIPNQVPAHQPPQNNQIHSELNTIKSSIQALSKTVADLQPKVKEAKAPPALQNPSPAGKPNTQGKGSLQPNTTTYASKAASKPRASLVLDLGAKDPDTQFDPNLSNILNDHMGRNGRADITFSAARYNKKGNLVLTAHHTTTQAQVNSVAEQIKTFYDTIADTNGIPAHKPYSVRPNVKWSKILMNSVPVGINAKLNRGS